MKLQGCDPLLPQNNPRKAATAWVPRECGDAKLREACNTLTGCSNRCGMGYRWGVFRISVLGMGFFGMTFFSVSFLLVAGV